MFLQRLDPNKTQSNKVQAQTIIIKSVITTFNYNFINTFRYTLFNTKEQWPQCATLPSEI